MPFDAQPHLRGDLVDLRPLTEADWADLYSVARDPAIWEQHPEADRYREDVFRKYFETGLTSQSALTIRATADGKVIGSSRYHSYNPEQRTVNIGWTFLGRTYWGGSYNREVKRLMLDHAFQFVDHVIFSVGIDNTRSQRALERIGAIPIEATSKRAEKLYYRINVRDWQGE